jgi:hypothetical protein
MNTYNIIGSMFGALLIALPIAADNTQQAYKNLKIQNKAIRKVGNQVKVAMDLNLDQIQLASNKGLTSFLPSPTRFLPGTVHYGKCTDGSPRINLSKRLPTNYAPSSGKAG